MKLLITSGGTKIPIDTVRHIANMSSGTFGSKIAYEALRAGHQVDFFHAKGSKTPFLIHENLAEIDYQFNNGRAGFDALIERMHAVKQDTEKYKPVYKETTYDSFSTYLLGLEKLVKTTNPDVIILAAAVSDYGVDNFVDGKIRSKDSDMCIRLKLLPKVISKVKTWAPNAYLVGFKLLVNSTESELVENAMKSIETNGCDMVVANDLRDIKNSAHQVFIVKPNKSPIMYHSASNITNANYLASKVVQQATER